MRPVAHFGAIVLLVGFAAASVRPQDKGIASLRRSGPLGALQAPRAEKACPLLHLVWLDATAAAAGLESFAWPEASQRLREAGAAVDWRRGEAGELARVGEVLVVVLDREQADGDGRWVLGASPPGSRPAPHCWIHFPGIERTLGLSPGFRQWRFKLLERRALGIALGRVVAHEVIHATAPGVGHGPGLMTERAGRRELLAPELRIDEEMALAVRAALRGWPLQSAPDPAPPPVRAAAAAVLDPS